MDGHPLSEWARSGIRADKILQVYDTNPGKVHAMTGGWHQLTTRTAIAATLFGKSHITAGITIGRHW
jgi:hypothetical protein